MGYVCVTLLTVIDESISLASRDDEQYRVNSNREKFLLFFRLSIRSQLRQEVHYLRSQFMCVHFDACAKWAQPGLVMLPPTLLAPE